MKKNEINDQQLEELVSEAIQNVGKRRDEALANELKKMSHEELDELLNETKQTDAPVARHARIGTILRFAAACAVLLLVLAGIHQLNLGNTTQNGYASLFDTYYKKYTDVDSKTFSAGEEKLNAKGKANTAYMIQVASVLINKNSKRSLHKGTALLEKLLKELPYKPELEHEIHWYLGLAYLKDNRIEKARNEFQAVIHLKSPHSADAKKLLEQTK